MIASAKVTSNMALPRQTRSDQLLNVVKDYEHIAVVTHDNPDPDAVSAGWAVCRLIRKSLDRQPRLIGGGDILRAENRHMMNLLQPPIELMQQFQPQERTAAILVDCGLQVAGHLLTSPNVRTVAVIDHHQTGSKPDIPFVDIRPRMAASATMTSGYLREQKLEPGERLATALLYAIRTETCGNEFRHTREDRSVILWLTRFANPEWLAAIESAPLPRGYFADLVLALQNTFLYDQSAFCLLPRAEGQEIVGEVADLLIRCEGVEQVFCGAAIADDLLCSVRTENELDSAAELVQATLHGLGFGGGHIHRAGGKVSNISKRNFAGKLEDELRERWLKACKVNRKRGTRLISRKEIVGSLTGKVL
ncbi:putative manganese-dependent inorganic pyrophosphatase [Fuerstiella marisgermanici]|uniref:Putative manganese-dependent inorganic pyrophosphatase n=2 Tax=Fuerstiella marisgermanici TaxID=1891926 RepID=A0A1P8WGE6_9PLAN|nr:putative manganese-dependent inorganic pyrophosphatase [Fuerstiella marisgermanici]